MVNWRCTQVSIFLPDISVDHANFLPVVGDGHAWKQQGDHIEPIYISFTKPWANLKNKKKWRKTLKNIYPPVVVVTKDPVGSFSLRYSVQPVGDNTVNVIAREVIQECENCQVNDEVEIERKIGTIIKLHQSVRW